MTAQRMADRLSPQVLRHLSETHRAIAREPLPTCDGLERVPAQVADAWLESVASSLDRAQYGRAYDEQAIRDHAENFARLCSRMSTLERRAEFSRGIGIEPPEGKRISARGACLRMDSPDWWRRQLRRAWTRSAEDALRDAGVIRRGRAPYVSDDAVAHYRARAARMRQWLESRAVVNEDGEQLPLLDIHEKSIANPALRRGEFMARMRGFEEVARDLGHVAEFVTLTAPSAFHAQLKRGGRNPKWQRESVRAAQQWLCRQWGRARALLHRRSVMFYGFRVAEPHHDGTPHWHMVLFVPAGQVETLRQVISGLWCAEYREELGTPEAIEARRKFVTIDPERGSAAGYVAKYVSKNIDAAGTIGDDESDETGAPVREGVQRVVAWASLHGIRQFQQVGGPPVGLWRELRRLRDPLAADQIESARAAADAGDWRAFVVELGGIERSRRRVVSLREKYRRILVRVPRVLSEERGPRGGKRYRPARPEEMPRVWMDRAAPKVRDRAGRDVFATTRYGETPAERAAGVCAFGLLGRYQAVDTRPHRWRIERKCASPGDGGTPDGTSALVAMAEALPSSSGSACSGSDSSAQSAVRSELGPVATTVTDTAPDASAGGAWEWVARVPFRRDAPEPVPKGAPADYWQHVQRNRGALLH